MTATKNTVKCLVCGQHIRQAANREVMLAHPNKTGKGKCPMSGQPIGATDT